MDNYVNNDTNNKSQLIKISGSIGMVKLVKGDNNIFIFYDDHSNIRYCNTSDSIFLYDLFENIIGNQNENQNENNSDYIILLEEPFVDNYSNIKFLWNDTPHIIKFRNFYKKIIKKCSDTKTCMIFPVDIRLIMCDVSMDELIFNLDNSNYFEQYDITIQEYFKYILYLFDYIEYDENKFKNSDSNIKFIYKVFNKFKDSDYYKKLKENFVILFNQYIKPDSLIKIKDFLYKNKIGIYSKPNGYPFTNDVTNNFLDQYDKLLNGLMEFYIYILMIGMNKKNIILYSGYYHSNNLTFILEKYYGFKNIYSNGKTTNIEFNKQEIINCLQIDKKIFF